MATVVEKSIIKAIRDAALSDKPLRISQVAGNIGIPTSIVRDHLRYLLNSGELVVENLNDLDETQALNIERVVAYGSAITQYVMDPGEAPTREETGREEVTDRDGRVLRASVQAEAAVDESGNPADGHTGRWILNVGVIQEGEVVDHLVIDRIFEPAEDGSAISGRDEAWFWWDEYKAGFMPVDDEDEDAAQAPAEVPTEPWPNGPHRFRVDVDGRRFEAMAIRREKCDMLEFTEHPGGPDAWFFAHATSKAARLYNDPFALENFAAELLNGELAKAEGSASE
jgi:hypothetical protein